MTARPVLLDLFCGAGGAAMGYHRAGFEVIGVDIEPQPNYPFRFVRGDALNPPFDLAGFAAIHASPPCPGYSRLAAMHPGRSWPLLIEPTRRMLIASGVAYVIENVEGAPLLTQPGLFGGYGVRLCGTSFGLEARDMDLRRHRLFETSFPVSQPSCRHRRRTIGVYGHGGNSTKHRMAYAHEARQALGIEWMNRDELSDAIPPAYTEWIGAQLLAHLGVAA